MPHSSPPGAPISAIRLLARQAERGTLRPVIPPEQRNAIPRERPLNAAGGDVRIVLRPCRKHQWMLEFLVALTLPDIPVKPGAACHAAADGRKRPAGPVSAHRPGSRSCRAVPQPDAAVQSRHRPALTLLEGCHVQVQVGEEGELAPQPHIAAVVNPAAHQVHVAAVRIKNEALFATCTASLVLARDAGSRHPGHYEPAAPQQVQPRGPGAGRTDDPKPAAQLR